MDLGFKTTFGKKVPVLGGQPTHFVEQILNGLRATNAISFKEFKKYLDDAITLGLIDVEYMSKSNIKMHTIRWDNGNRWEPGKKIHFVVGQRTRERYQFAPIIECKSVQDVEVIYTDTGVGFKRHVEVDGRTLSDEELERLAKLDGFKNTNDFFSWFNTDFKGKLIHWSGLWY